MFFQSIKLENFRNYETVELNLSPGVNIIYGKNAQGKTNLLESIYVLAFTKSHRSFIDNSLIMNNQKYASITGFLKDEITDKNIKLSLTSTTKKIVVDNNQVKKISDYISTVNVIIFYPEDLDIIKGSPGDRRKFLNSEISQLYSNYYVAFSEYSKLLKMRNDYIKVINQGKNYDLNYFHIITDYLISKAVSIYKLRKKFIDRLNENATIIFKNISGMDNFYITYNTNINIENYTTEEITNKMKEKFNQNYDEEIRLRSTLIGPHKDDIEFYIGDLNLKYYGSQGQQRMAILALKLAEIDILKKYKNKIPILLLDDVFSELDDIKKNNLLSYINDKTQTIITITDLNNIDNSIISSAKLIEIDNGSIINQEEVK